LPDGQKRTAPQTGCFDPRLVLPVSWKLPPFPPPPFFFNPLNRFHDLVTFPLLLLIHPLFRYTGRTQKEIIEFVRENYVKRQSFQRFVFPPFCCDVMLCLTVIEFVTDPSPSGIQVHFIPVEWVRAYLFIRSCPLATMLSVNYFPNKCVA
jgi:hypothetical protein